MSRICVSLICAILLWTMAVMAAEPVWNVENGFKGIGRTSRVKCAVEGDGLHLTDIEFDPIVEIACNFRPQQYNLLTYTYKAEGTGRRSGQLYYSPGGSFNDNQLWMLPALIADGKWHTVTLKLDAAVRNPNDWRKWSAITKIRFDATDDAGGEIVVSEIRFSSDGNLKAAVVEKAPAKIAAWTGDDAAPVKSDDRDAFWSQANDFCGFGAAQNAEMYRSGNGLVVLFSKADTRIPMAMVDLNPTRCNTLIYKYRASGVGLLGGQLFYAHAGETLSDERKWNLPSLEGDGEWHTVELKYNSLVNGYDWFEEGPIQSLRFDPTDSEGGWMELADLHFEYRPENAKRFFKQASLPKSEPQLLSEPWSEVVAGHAPEEAPVHDYGKYFECKMISSPGEKGVFYLRKSFVLKEKPFSAWLQFIADDRGEAFVNGKPAATSRDWRKTTCKEVTKLMTAGRNVLAFRYENSRSDGGVFGELYVKYADGREERINTDKSFVSSPRAQNGWNSANSAFDSAGWEPVRFRNGPPSSPWTAYLEYVDFATANHLEAWSVTPAEMTAGDVIHFAAKYTSTMPPIPFDARLVVRKGAADGSSQVVWEECVSLTEENVRMVKGGWELSFDYESPLYLGAMECEVSLESTRLYCHDNGYPRGKVVMKRAEKTAGFEEAPVFKVENIGGSPAFTLNGKPFYPLWGACNRHARPDGLPKHGPAQANLVTLYPRNIWSTMDSLGLEDFDVTAELYRRSNPDAYFIVNLPFYPPWEFKTLYPDDMCRDDHGEINEDGRICYSFASKRMLSMFEEALDQMLDYLESSPYANRIVGYRVVGGHTIEWLGWDPKPGRTVDFSPVAKEAFTEYMAKNHPDIQDTSIPSYRERMELDGNLDILWDPKKHERVIAYNNFYSEMVADMTIKLCARAKKRIGANKVVGTYYGYSMTLGASGSSQLRAHYAMKKFMDSKCVDFVMSPQPYRVRNIGDPMGDMKPFASIAANGMIPVIEDDTRTYRSPKGMGYFQMPNEQTSADVIQRNFATVLCRNTPAYFYALTAGTEFDFPAAGATLNDTRVTGQHCLDKGVRRNAEVAIVVSEETIKAMPLLTQSAANGDVEQSYSDDGKVVTSQLGGAVFTNDALEHNYAKFACTGAPVDYVLAEDLADHPGDYKLYIFSNCIKYDDKFLAAIEMLRKRQCTLFWMYAPGYTHGDENSLENMKRLTRISFGLAAEPLMPAVTLRGEDKRLMGTKTTRVSPMFFVDDSEARSFGRYENGTTGLARKKTGEAVSIFCGVWNPDVPFLQKLFADAGVHIYSQEGDPLEANEHLVTIHARNSGKKTIVLPEKTDVLDIFQHKIIARNVREFSFDARLHCTHFFYYGLDADDLLRKLEAEK